MFPSFFPDWKKENRSRPWISHLICLQISSHVKNDGIALFASWEDLNNQIQNKWWFLPQQQLAVHKNLADFSHDNFNIQQKRKVISSTLPSISSQCRDSSKTLGYLFPKQIDWSFQVEASYFFLVVYVIHPKGNRSYF